MSNLLKDQIWFNKKSEELTIEDCQTAYENNFVSVIENGKVVRLRGEYNKSH